MSRCRNSIRHYVKANREFVIELKVAIGQGYSWKIKDSSQTVDFVKETFKNENADADGADGIQQFYFKSRALAKAM